MQCIVCENILPNEHKLNYNDALYNKEYKLYHCNFCHTEFFYPNEAINREYYEDENKLLNTEFLLGRDTLAPRHDCFFLKLPIKHGKLLDIGCADGLFMKHSIKIGFDSWGIDFNRKIIEKVQNSGLMNVYSLTPEELLKGHDNKFDVITVFEVLEHQSLPRDFMESIKCLLKKGGYIAGSVPNRHRFRSTMTSTEYPPHHFLWFDKKSLRNFLRMQGFDNIQIFFTKGIYYPNYLVNIGDLLRKFLFKTSGKQNRINEDLLKKFNPSIKKRNILYFKFIKNIMLSVLLPYNLFSIFTGWNTELYFQARLKDGHSPNSN